jgi:hypothetical protein
MVKYKGRVTFKEYMPQKPVKRGYKIWVRADLFRYLMDFQIYTGKESNQAEQGLGETVVQDGNVKLQRGSKVFKS